VGEFPGNGEVPLKGATKEKTGDEPKNANDVLRACAGSGGQSRPRQDPQLAKGQRGS